jgi:hypothetical protein
MGRERKGTKREGRKYRRINNTLVACIVVNVDCDATEGRDFGGEVVEAVVVLAGEEVSLVLDVIAWYGM